MNENTPTNDEREVPKQGLCDRCGWAISGHVRSQYGLDCPPGGYPEAVYSPDAAPLLDADGDPISSGEHRRIVMAGRDLPVCDTCTNVLGLNIRWDQSHPEPQGEPSDAQVHALTVLEEVEPLAEVFGNSTAFGRSVIALRRLVDERAALRAAGVAK